MIYRDFRGMKLSALGFGTMRLPVIDGNDGRVDEDTVRRMIDTALEQGINYFDTAWGYHGGASETVIGNILADVPRDRFYLASKFPGYDLKNMGRTEKIFEEQLKKCRVDHFDFYLVHNVCETNIEAYLDDEKYHTLSYLIRQKQEGRIRHLGFSAHGSIDVIQRFLDAYREHLEFCQIQLNWLDWTLQSAKAKIDLLNDYSLPIWVMEPLRGGRLVHLSPENSQKLLQLRPEESIAAWSFRFLQGLPGVTVILSGMSDENQLRDNLHIFETEAPLSAAERETLFAIAGDMTRETTVPCTGCRYCTTHCPMHLNIPWLLNQYSDNTFSNGSIGVKMAIDAQPENKRPSACLGCRSCEKVCPQQIEISKIMADLAAALKR